MTRLILAAALYAVCAPGVANADGQFVTKDQSEGFLVMMNKCADHEAVDVIFGLDLECMQMQLGSDPTVQCVAAGRMPWKPRDDGRCYIGDRHGDAP